MDALGKNFFMPGIVPRFLRCLARSPVSIPTTLLKDVFLSDDVSCQDYTYIVSGR